VRSASSFFSEFFDFSNEGHPKFHSVQIADVVLYVSYATVVAFKSPKDHCAWDHHQKMTQRHLCRAGFALKERVPAEEFHERLMLVLSESLLTWAGSKLGAYRLELQTGLERRAAEAEEARKKGEDEDSHRGSLFDPAA
jgi:hypothetical protein